jgi:hypothetical protein
VERARDVLTYWKEAPPVNEIAVHVFRKDGDSAPMRVATDEEFARALGAAPARKAG